MLPELSPGSLQRVTAGNAAQAPLFRELLGCAQAADQLPVGPDRDSAQRACMDRYLDTFWVNRERPPHQVPFVEYHRWYERSQGREPRY